MKIENGWVIELESQQCFGERSDRLLINQRKNFLNNKFKLSKFVIIVFYLSFSPKELNRGAPSKPIKLLLLFFLFGVCRGIRKFSQSFRRTGCSSARFGPGLPWFLWCGDPASRTTYSSRCGKRGRGSSLQWPSPGGRRCRWVYTWLRSFDSDVRSWRDLIKS